jgi:recombination endonuclease VII
MKFSKLERKQRKKASNRRYQATHNDAHRAKCAKWRADNQRHVHEYKIKQRLANQAKVMERIANGTSKHPAKERDILNQFGSKHLELVQKFNAKYGNDRKELQSERNAQHYANHREDRLSSKRTNLYGLSDFDINKMNDEQGFQCAICHEVDLDKKRVGKYPGKAKTLYIDHHHSTSINRGLLCSGCNTTLGMMDESPARLRAAADYLELHAALAVGKWLESFAPQFTNGGQS